MKHLIQEYKAKTIYREGFKTGWDDGRRFGWNDGWDNGRKSGQEEGRILDCIEMCREDLHMTDAETIEKLIKKFGISRDKAEKYLEKEKEPVGIA